MDNLSILDRRGPFFILWEMSGLYGLDGGWTDESLLDFCGLAGSLIFLVII